MGDEFRNFFTAMVYKTSMNGRLPSFEFQKRCIVKRCREKENSAFWWCRVTGGFFISALLLPGGVNCRRGFLVRYLSCRYFREHLRLC